MILLNKKRLSVLIQGITALGNGAESPLKSAHIPDNIIHAIRDIINNYSFKHPGLITEMIATLLFSDAPEQGLRRLDHFLNSSHTALDLPSFSRDMPFILAGTFYASGALSTRLGSNEQIVPCLSSLRYPLEFHGDREYYTDFLSTHCTRETALSERIRAVHLFHTVHLIRICARNVKPDIPISEITAELSLLADVVIESCLSIAHEEFSRKYTGGLRTGSFFVLGLGKLGGNELNVSSDIDLLYLCAEKSGWNSFEDMNMHTSLAERLTQLLTEATELGYLYRVDTRLRADGASGPLVRTTADYHRYLEMRGEAWERQMLLKARPVAGNIDAGHAFLASLERFIFPASLTRSPNREIVALKNQIESRIIAEGSEKTHLKLMPGGIRDIEFITQCLQLIMGGKHPEVRCTGTLAALEKLRDVGALSPEEYKTLFTAYTLYRRVENVLQWREFQPSFTLPAIPAELAKLSSSLARDNLSGELDETLLKVRMIYDEIFNVESSESFEAMAIRAVCSPPDDEKVKRFLENLGFHHPEQSARNLSQLVHATCSGTTEMALHPSIEQFLPDLLHALSELPDPGSTLKHFRLIADAYNAHATLFGIMENNPKFFELLITITHSSVFLTGILVRDPSLLDWLVEAGEILQSIREKDLLNELREIDRNTPDDLAFSRECVRINLREILRIGTRDITGIAGQEDTFAELNTLAECIVIASFKRACRTLYAEKYPLRKQLAFGIISAGKLGSETMDFGSDLDIIFVFRDSHDTGDIQENAIKLAQHILALINGGGVHKIYSVDARLRPEGGNAPLAISLDEYRRYFKRRASAWERLAMVRSRYLTGVGNMDDEVNEIIEGFVYRAPLTRCEIEEILDIRKKMIASGAKEKAGLVDVKTGKGGATDIDFIAQSYAIHFGKEHPAVRHRTTTHILDSLGTASILDRHDATTLKELYSFFCTVEKAIRIGSGKSVNTLPPFGVELERVARLNGFKNVRRFKKRLDDAISVTGDYYDRLMQHLLDSASDGPTPS